MSPLILVQAWAVGWQVSVGFTRRGGYYWVLTVGFPWEWWSAVSTKNGRRWAFGLMSLRGEVSPSEVG